MMKNDKIIKAPALDKKMQEAVANLLQVKDEYVKGVHELYLAYVKVGFSEEQALKLVITFTTPSVNK